ncbi:scamp family-domain-containing protein [Phakopsora pachyrhizi]|uniref:Scamp family-domain-containing protein n=1 Tax=Phakopsora pachyrhizi TaxID=170000 RepID=A0AAV0BS41_PHAPC|nr:scamp family-domain-containing protein [Phakopsora pachyrhizi]
MADYSQKNPFQDPQHQQHGLDANPFEDPSVQGALGSNTTYNETGYSLEASHSENTLGASTVISGRSDDTAARLAEIKRKEAELEQRERSLGTREEHVKNYGRNNWPPFYPIFFHDIEQEIPIEKRADVTTIYRGWLFLVLTLAWNLLTTIFILTSGASSGGAGLGSGIFYFPGVITALSFLLWYRPVYNAYAKEHSLFYLLYFVFGGFHVIFCFYMLIGIPGTGSAGVINTIAAFGRGSIFTGILGIIASAAWALLSLGNAWMWKAVWKHWHDKGHTFGQAKQEVATSGLRAYFGKGNNL